MKRIFITGSAGQIGTELTMKLRKIYGNDNVIASDIKPFENKSVLESGPFEYADCLNASEMAKLIKKYNIDTIYHLAAILSGVAEAKPNLAWDVNINGLYNILEIAREYKCAVFTPSSIGAFGPNTPKEKTPQDTIQRPTTMYGVTKVAGELLCDYYHKKFGVDTRGVRYPGLISNVALPGGGTTDYAVEIFYEAIKNQRYTSYIKAGTFMDMMYMPDALDAAVDIMEADSSKLVHRNAFNVTAMSFDPEMLADAIKKYIPEFKMDYEIDPVRQEIAESWPDSLDDSAAKEEWGWNPKYDLDKMTRDMIEVLNKKLEK